MTNTFIFRYAYYFDVEEHFIFNSEITDEEVLKVSKKLR